MHLCARVQLSIHSALQFAADWQECINGSALKLAEKAITRRLDYVRSKDLQVAHKWDEFSREELES